MAAQPYRIPLDMRNMEHLSQSEVDHDRRFLGTGLPLGCWMRQHQNNCLFSHPLCQEISRKTNRARSREAGSGCRAIVFDEDG
jgi:hypothetical protein